jgi:hypothetical protein
VVWSCSTPFYGVVKARDFCSLVHLRKLKDGTVVVLQRAIEHPRAAPGSRPGAFQRGKLVLAANIIEPIPGQKHKAHVTMITQVDPGGFAPAFIVNKVTKEIIIVYIGRTLPRLPLRYENPPIVDFE